MLLQRFMGVSIALFCTLGMTATANAAPLLFTSPEVVLATDTLSGPTFLVPVGLTSTDTLSLTVDGLVCLQGGGAYCTNAAGVVVTPGSQPTGAALPFGSTTYGALLLGNTTLGFFQVFPTDAANGLGSGAPPSTLTQTTTLGALGFAGGIPGGSTLEWRVADTPNTDNSGSFRITEPNAVPEPSSILLLGMGLLGLASWRRRKA
jgi:hypothetical protein